MSTTWTPKERANYMARIIREGKNLNNMRCNGRTFSGCLEWSQEENDEVLQILWGKAQRSSKLKENLFRYISKDAFENLEN
jgi:hypothetical protein|tara:strand:+ start:182 stop:424 length:243 start_codon:yes stop_codon:yes gene_type:complete